MAGGRGRRLGHELPKALVPVAGKSIVAHSVDAVCASDRVDGVVVVLPAGASPPPSAVSGVPVFHVVGGAERRDSVAAGLAAVPGEADVVLVHDAARCFAPAGLFSRVVDAVRQHHVAVVPGLPVTDTIKVVSDDGTVAYTPPRERLVAVQTPQGFPAALLRRVHGASPADTDATATDDASLVEASGGRVHVVPGEPAARKVTVADDLRWAADMAAGAPAAAP